MFAESNCTLWWVEIKHVFFSKAEGGASYLSVSAVFAHIPNWRKKDHGPPFDKILSSHPIRIESMTQTIDQKYPSSGKFKETWCQMISEKRSNPGTNSGFGISHSPTINHQRPLPIKKKKSLTKQRCFQENNCLCMLVMKCNNVILHI